MISVSPFTSSYFVSVKNVSFLYDEYFKSTRKILILGKFSCYAKYSLCSGNETDLLRLTHCHWLDNPHYPEHTTNLRTNLSELEVSVVYFQDALESSLRIYLFKQNSNFQILWLWLVPALNKSAIKKNTHTHFGDNQVNLTMDWVLDIRELWSLLLG